MSDDAIGTAIGWFQLVFGFAYLVWGLRGNAFQGDHPAGKQAARTYFVPMGLWWILSAVFHFLRGHVPETPLITGAVVSFVAVGVWLFRAHRAFRAQLQDLNRKREHSKP